MCGERGQLNVIFHGLKNWTQKEDLFCGWLAGSPFEKYAGAQQPFSSSAAVFRAATQPGLET
jgi:hypothetical protein